MPNYQLNRIVISGLALGGSLLGWKTYQADPLSLRTAEWVQKTHPSHFADAFGNRFSLSDGVFQMQQPVTVASPASTILVEKHVTTTVAPAPRAVTNASVVRLSREGEGRVAEMLYKRLMEQSPASDPWVYINAFITHVLCLFLTSWITRLWEKIRGRGERAREQEHQQRHGRIFGPPRDTATEADSALLGLLGEDREMLKTLRELFGGSRQAVENWREWMDMNRELTRLEVQKLELENARLAAKDQLKEVERLERTAVEFKKMLERVTELVENVERYEGHKGLLALINQRVDGNKQRLDGGEEESQMDNAGPSLPTQAPAVQSKPPSLEGEAEKPTPTEDANSTLRSLNPDWDSKQTANLQRIVDDVFSKGATSVHVPAGAADASSTAPAPKAVSANPVSAMLVSAKPVSAKLVSSGLAGTSFDPASTDDDDEEPLSAGTGRTIPPTNPDGSRHVLKPKRISARVAGAVPTGASAPAPAPLFPGFTAPVSDEAANASSNAPAPAPAPAPITSGLPGLSPVNTAAAPKETTEESPKSAKSMGTDSSDEYVIRTAAPAATTPAAAAPAATASAAAASEEAETKPEQTAGPLVTAKPKNKRGARGRKGRPKKPADVHFTSEEKGKGPAAEVTAEEEEAEKADGDGDALAEPEGPRRVGIVIKR